MPAGSSVVTELSEPPGRPEAGPPDRPSPPFRKTQDWRPFLRALAEELDTVAGPNGRDTLLHGVGRQLARLHPLSPRDSIDGLALEMNEVLDAFGWGQVDIAFDGQNGCLLLTHQGFPRVGGLGDPPGSWLAGVLTGLYEGWLAQQPGADAFLAARRMTSSSPEAVIIRYGKT